MNNNQISKEIVKGSLKLVILQTLYESEHYGYSLAQDIRKRSEHYLKAGEGSLYPALHNLENKGLIKSKWKDEFIPRRKYYYITPKGKSYLQKEKDDWNILIGVLTKYI